MDFLPDGAHVNAEGAQAAPFPAGPALLWEPLLPSYRGGQRAAMAMASGRAILSRSAKRFSSRWTMVAGMHGLPSSGMLSEADEGPIDGRKYSIGNGPSTMKAAVLWKAKGSLELELLQIPRPKAGEVLLKVKACGVCHTDLHVLKGDQPFPIPCVLGHEVTGEVVEHGPNTDPGTVRRVPLGSRVVGAFIMPCGGCYFCTQGNEDICSTFFDYNRIRGGLYDGETRLFRASNGAPISMYSMGGLAEFCVIPATAVTPLPSSLPYAESAIMGCAMFTAYGAMRNAADMRAGQTVAVIGTGGVGLSCVQVAKAFGGSAIIAVDVAESKLERARTLGATHTINASSQDVVATIQEITGGLGVDIAVEALGKASTFAQGVLCVRDGGRAVMVGIAPKGVTAEVDIARVVRRNISIVGSYGAKARKDLPTLVRMAERRLLDVASAVTERHPLEAAAQVYEALEEGRIVGRAIVDMEL